MAGLSDQVINKEKIKVTENDKKFDYSKDEIKFILAKIAQVEFKGVEIEFTYNLIVKLQEHFKYLSKTQLIVSGSSPSFKDVTVSNNITGSGNLEIKGNISGSVTTTGSFGFLEASNILFELDDNGDIMPV